MIAMCRLRVVYFFKQKTAYEMRISDWSSDVCSSDLSAPRDLVVRDPKLPFHPWLGGVVAILGKQWLAAPDRVATLLRVQTLPVAFAQDHEVGVHPDRKSVV